MFKKVARYFFIIILYFVIFVMIIYLSMRLFLMIKALYFWYDKILGSFLLFAEFFIITQGVGYLSEVITVFLKYKDPEEDRPEVPKLKTNPYVDILIPSYHEPLSVIEDTIIGCYNLTYKNKKIFLLDDSKYDEKDLELKKYKDDVEELCKKYKINLFRRKWRGAKAGIINDYLAFIQGVKNEDFKFNSFEDNIEKQKQALEKPKYIVILDADQNPYPNFVEPLVAMSEQDEKLAFIQTPQYYTNFQKNKIAYSAALQQVVFFEYICVGKGIKEAIFCCGSNVLLRTDALIEIGGFDEKSVTEDSATSLYFHMKGWKTKYYNKVGVFGMGPEDLANYFKQQYRWALGSIDLFKTVVINLIKHPTKLNFIKWWEYLISTSFYFSSLVYIILWICPILYLLFGIPSFFASATVYGVVFLPYFVLSMTVFYWSLKKRHYKGSDIFKGQALLWITFPVFIKAAIYGLIGKKKKFEVTSKLGAQIYPFSKLLPQIIFGLICFFSVIWGLNRLYYERYHVFAVIANSIWTFYNFGIMMSIFYFNSPKKIKKKQQQVII